MELKTGKTVYVTKENPKIQNTPTSGRVHSIGTNHVVIRTAGGTGLYKVHKDNISHDRNDSWLAKKYRTEAKDPKEYGFEGEMAMSQLKGIMQHAEQLHGMLKPETDLPEWVQSKITLAYDYMQTAADYMSTEMSESYVVHSLGRYLADPRGATSTDDIKKAHRFTKAQAHSVADKMFKHDVKQVSEEVEDLDELSKSTLKSYLGKAGSGKQYSNPQHFRSSMLSQDTAKAKLGRKSRKDVKVMASEETQIDELSKDTLNAYLKRNATDVANKNLYVGKARRKEDPEEVKRLSNKIVKRHDGEFLAKKKLAKEEAPANAVGSGNIAGMGVGPDGEPGVTPAAMARYKRKNKAEEPKAGRKSFSIFMKGK